ncbi:MAG TPA: acetyl/propionyl/methylcrotonyl-CoA carboxylase subunit alpha [Arenimonas sp.]|uniref:acetyl/propionyl/methylcrotonyl-CoA carboxylase subunit alpha n=1 Tax=Arenimonas sp. TaxID=1872635 RepID=UPI002D7FEC3F|nr:acetyl/propionyl/methylcrotonyl-CoA carboxylase subunit alpha [Arenimonas sp.]HEU0152372.1 acetyl/propionyl/methylcrotonyl-CoA carboxylase subunit alpha [Arenimonas sp.]
MFKKILIANRGEIACRIIRTCRRLGIRTAAVYSEADAHAQHARLADEAWPIGGPRPQDSYLRGEAIIDVAKRAGAQAIHPGYGFLSENADFAEAVEAAGITFIGPGAASMRKMGSKAGAKQLMHAQGVPVVPGYTGEDQAPAHLQAEADRIGYPLMIKAAHGGGGKGMRIVREAGEFAAALESCQREAASAFGRDRVLLERYIGEPRHIEIQVFADRHGQTIHLGERECSAQRRYQKVVEESPSPFLTPALRLKMGEAAIEAARAIDYVNAGTVEFIVGPQGDFYFMEINTRLQVEHPVTELVTGLDLVEWQLRVAAGEHLPLHQQDITHRGHAIEVRLYAEDPAQGFLPGSGKLERLRLPAPSAHVRLDAGVVEGDTVTIFYDPMIAKLIVWDLDRPRALARLREALADCEIAGPKSNIDFLEKLVRHPRVVEGTIHTAYLDRHLEEVLPRDSALPDAHLALAAAAAALHDEASTRAAAGAGGDPHTPWAIADGWRLGHAGERLLCFLHRGERIEVHARGSAGDYDLRIGERELSVRGARHADGRLGAEVDGRQWRMRVHADAGAASVHDGEHRVRLERVPAFRFDGNAAAGRGDRLVAPMPGRIVLVKARPGQAVAEGEELLVMEAMKMELSLKAPRAGTVATVQATAGDFVESDAVLVKLEAS